MNIYFDTTIELEAMTIEAQVVAWYEPGEPMVRYYPDGSGYPGSPPEMTIERIEAYRITGETYDYQRSDNPDWFDLLDDILNGMIDALQDRLIEEAFDNVSDYY